MSNDASLVWMRRGGVSGALGGRCANSRGGFPARLFGLFDDFRHSPDRSPFSPVARLSFLPVGNWLDRNSVVP